MKKKFGIVTMKASTHFVETSHAASCNHFVSTRFAKTFDQTSLQSCMDFIHFYIASPWRPTLSEGLRHGMYGQTWLLTPSTYGSAAGRQTGRTENPSQR